MKTFKKVLEIILDVIIVLLFAVSILVIITSANQRKTGYPSLFGHSVYTVQSSSMDPTIKKGDLIFDTVYNPVQKLNAEMNFEVGDVISFKQVEEQNGQKFEIINTHRIVRIDEADGITRYWTQGDNKTECPEEDPIYKTTATIIGKYDNFRIPLLGGFLDFIKEPLGFILVIIMPIALFIGFQVFKLFKIYFTVKKEELAEASANNAQISADNASDEMKEQIIKEYLEKQKNSTTSKDSDNLPKD